MSMKELFSVLKRGNSKRHSVPRSFMWILFSLLFMWSIILETKYFFDIEICSRFWANDPGLSWLNSVTNISNRTSSSVISRDAKINNYGYQIISCWGLYPQPTIFVLPIFCISCIKLSINETSLVAMMKSSLRSQIPLTPFKNSPSL